MMTSAPSETIRPWVKADTIEWPAAYWAPLSGFPARTLERQWLSHVLTGLWQWAGSRSLVPHPFLPSHVLQRQFGHVWRTQLMQLLPLLVYGRRPWEPPPAQLSEDVLARAMDPQQPFPDEQILRGMYYWCHCGSVEPFARTFAGYGGLIFLFAEPNGDLFQEIPRALLENPFLQERLGSAVGRAALNLAGRAQAPWAKKLKAALLHGWENFEDCRQLPLILPCLQAVDFVSLPAEFFQCVLTACPLYFRESPEDGGVLLLAAEPLDPVLAELQSTWMDQLQREEHAG